MEPWQEEQRSKKRFPHKSQTGRNARGRHAQSSIAGQFRPRNMLGRYSVRSPFLEKLATSRLEQAPSMWLEIHELVASNTAYLATFDFGAVTGVMIIAGSRKSLLAAVNELDEEPASSSADESVDSCSDVEYDGQKHESSLQGSIMTEEDPDLSKASKVDAFIAPPDLERPDHAFEKNTFRTPKWFAQWRGRIAHPNVDQTDLDESGPKFDTDGRAHLEFTSAICQELNATFSCPAIEAKEAAWQGWKITGKATVASCSWNDFAT